MELNEEKCVLRSVDRAYKDVTIWNNKPVVMGRSIDTKIKDKRCSKQQVELHVDFISKVLSVKQVGGNSSAINGVSLSHGSTAEARHRDTLEVLTGAYHYTVEFTPPPRPAPEQRLLDTSSSRDQAAAAAIARAAAASTTDAMPPKKRPATEPAAPDAGNKKAKIELNTWKTVENGDILIYNQLSLPGSTKVAGYDMDGTLILTQSGKVFPKDYNDWRIIFSEVPGKLKDLHKDGYKIIIFTNQAGILAGKQSVQGVQGKIGRIIGRLGVPVQAFVSTGRGKFRKPAPFMWEYMEQHCNGGVAMDRSQSVYVGDAAGRPEVPKVKKKDFSSADRLYAINLGVPFRTPEEHFLGRKTEVFNMPEFDPRNLDMKLPQYEPAATKVPGHKTELIVMVGWPGSGKSVYATSVLGPLGYAHANRDTVGSWQKCAALAQKALKSGQSVVVDNTNPDRESRARFVKVATDLKLPARCFILDVSKDHARHNNKFREFTDSNHSKVSDMIYNMYKSKFLEPSKSEGFIDIVKVNFVPKFGDKGDEKLYRMFLLEK